MENNWDWYAARKNRHQAPSLPHKSTNEHRSSKPTERSKSRPRDDSRQHRHPDQGRREDHVPQDLPSQQNHQSKGYTRGHEIQTYPNNYRSYPDPASNRGPQLKSALKPAHSRNEIPHHMSNGHEAEYASSDEFHRRENHSPLSSKLEAHSTNWANPWNAYPVKRKPSQQIQKSPAKAAKTSHPVHPFAAGDGSVDDERDNAQARPSQARSRPRSVSRGRGAGQENSRPPPKTTKIITFDSDGNKQVLEIPVEQLKHARTIPDGVAFAEERRKPSPTRTNLPHDFHVTGGQYGDHQERARSRQPSSHPAITYKRSQSVARDSTETELRHNVKYPHTAGYLREADDGNHTSINGRGSHHHDHRRSSSVSNKQLDTRGHAKQSRPVSQRRSRAISVSDEEAGEVYSEAASPSAGTDNKRPRISDEIRSQRAAQTLDYDGDVAMSDHRSNHQPSQQSSRGPSNWKSAEAYQREPTKHFNSMDSGKHAEAPRPDSPPEYDGPSNPIDGLKARLAQKESQRARSESPMFFSYDNDSEASASQQGKTGLDQQEEPSRLQQYLSVMNAKMKGDNGAPKKTSPKSRGNTNPSQNVMRRDSGDQRTVLNPGIEECDGAGSFDLNTEQDGYPEDWQDAVPKPSDMEARTTGEIVHKKGSTGAVTGGRADSISLKDDTRLEAPSSLRGQYTPHGRRLEKDRLEPNKPTQMPTSALSTPIISPVSPNKHAFDINGEQSVTFKHQQQHPPPQDSGKDIAQTLTRFVDQNDKEAEQRAKALADARQRQRLLDRQFLARQTDDLAERGDLIKPSKASEGALSSPPKTYDRTGIQSLQARKHTTGTASQTRNEKRTENTGVEVAKMPKGSGPNSHSEDAPTKSVSRNKNLPLDPRKITEPDRMLWRLRNNSNARWEDIFLAWKREAGASSTITSKNGLGARYRKLQATVAKYGSLRPSEAQIIEYLKEVGAQDSQSIIESLPDSERSFQSDVAETRPTTGGKTVSVEIMRAYLASLDEQVFESEAEDDEAVLEETAEVPRAPSPPHEEDKCHWVYYIKRKVFKSTQNESDVDWVRVGPTFTNVKRANVASMAEINKERGDVDVWPLKSWHWEGDDVKGMSRHVGKSDKGTVLVSVDRYLQTFKDGRLPETREGFLKKEVYVVFVRTSTYAVIECYGQNEQQLPQPIEGGEASTAGFEHSNPEPAYDEASLNIDQQDLESLNLDDIFGDMSNLPADVHLAHEQGLPTEEPWSFDPLSVMNMTNPGEAATNAATESTYEMAGNAECAHNDEKSQQTRQTEINGAQATEYQQDDAGPESRPPAVSNRTLRNMVQEPLEGIYSVMDAANRAAGRHLLGLKKLQVPVARRNKMDEILAAQKAERAMNERLDELEQAGERFKDRMEVDQQDDTDSGQRQVQAVEVWVEERSLEVPRNI